MRTLVCRDSETRDPRELLPIAIVAALPAACIALKIINTIKLLLSPRPIFEIRKMMNVDMKALLRPHVSLNGPHMDGAIPWTTIYTVIVSDTSVMCACMSYGKH